MKIKLEHYVPQFYLKNFSQEEGKKHIIECFDKIDKKQFRTDISKIACENFFYDLKEDINQETEKNLAIIEGKSNVAISKLVHLKDIIKLSNEEKYLISLFIAIQDIRTKENREMSKDLINQMVERLSKEKLSSKLAKEVKEIQTNEAIKKIQIKSLNDAQKLANIIFQMKWILFINKTKIPFWTSDNPVVLHNEINFMPYGNLGLRCIGIEVHFPLTPKMVLITCDPVSFAHEPNKKITKDFRNIIRERDLQVRYSTRFIFSNSPNFEFVKTMLKENPSLGDINRRRVSLR